MTEDSRGELVLFLPDEEYPELGLGWFKQDGVFRAYWRYKTGYEKMPRVQIHADVIRKLVEHL